MISKSVWAAAMAAVLAVSVGACANSQDVSEIKSKVNEIQAQQKDVLAKLEALKAGQKQLKVAAPARAARPKVDHGRS